MTIKFSCARCFHHYRYKDSAAGKEVVCKQCGGTIRVPGVAAFDRSVRELHLGDGVRLVLVKLRLITQLELASIERPISLGPAHLDLELVVDVEQALRCQFHDEILAVLAAGDRYLDERDFRLDRIAALTADAQGLGLPTDEIAIGRGDEGDTFHCVPRQPGDDWSAAITDHFLDDQSWSNVPLLEWLELHLQSRNDVVADTNPELAARVPTDKELADFRPALVSRLA